VDTAAQMFASGNHQAIGVGILLLFALPVPVFTFTFYTIHKLMARPHPTSKRLYYKIDEKVLKRRGEEPWYRKIFVQPIAGSSTLGAFKNKSIVFSISRSTPHFTVYSGAVYDSLVYRVVFY
jgi:hypothetical protein